MRRNYLVFARTIFRSIGSRSWVFSTSYHQNYSATSWPLFQRMSAFKFLVTTDNHLGFKDDDHIRANDSYLAFEEALSIARAQDVDFILLGGDLFHVNKPSTTVEHKCIKIIRQHMNSSNKQIQFKKLSGSFSHISSLEHPNFEDANFNVSHPILTIHGNHDDPTGSQNQSVCEKLATTGLLNYFGLLSLKSQSVTVSPIVLEKDNVKLAIYGIGFIPDARLKIAFEKKEIVFEEPPEDSFNVLIAHQNRANINKDRYISDDLFPKFLHLIIRGHEHEAQAPQKLLNSKNDTLVWQPGSTVATSINFMESLPKKVGVVNVTKEAGRKPKCVIDLINLKSIRPMIVKNIFREDILKFAQKRYSEKAASMHDRWFIFSRGLAEETLNEIIDSRNNRLESLPLVRLRIEYLNKDEKFDDTDLVMQHYNKFTANKDLILFRKQKLEEGGGSFGVNKTFEETSSLMEMFDDDFERINLSQEKSSTIDAMIESYFNNLPMEERLLALSLKEYTKAVSNAMDEGNVIGKVVKQKSNCIMKEYEGIICDEAVAEEQFCNQQKVNEWFIAKFKASNSDFNTNQGGDKLDLDFYQHSF